jgi:hypothetical protein
MTNARKEAVQRHRKSPKGNAPNATETMTLGEIVIALRTARDITWRKS